MGGAVMSKSAFFANNSSSDASDSASLSEQRTYNYTVWHHGMWYGMVVAACALLLYCALLAGLTLAMCGLDMAWLQMRVVTGTPKQQKRAVVVINMKRHSTWMLCSLIICSVGAGESFPFFIQSLWHGPQLWVPILTSTLLLGIFAEILPQHIIPKNAINWGYFCSPLIWTCMILTAIISYPLARLLDTFFPAKKRKTFTNSEIAALIKYHGQSEKHGGKIGQDATRVMLGALQFNSAKIGVGVHKVSQGIAMRDAEKDVEMVDLNVANGIIVNWSAVKTVDIDEPVDRAFIRKVKCWSYSRIPVTGNHDHNSTKSQDWDGKRIYGFLHIKNLLGLDIDDDNNPDNCIFVRDLPLYPLPIVQGHTSVYELLNIFQLGMSRMAVVIPLSDSENAITLSPGKKVATLGSRKPCWTATQRTNARIVSRMKAAGSEADWTTDWATGFLEAAQIDIKSPKPHKENVIGIRSPRPIGIITFEDIIDTLLQKTSRDERDFYDRDNTAPPTKKIKAGDILIQPLRSRMNDKENSLIRSSASNKAHVSFQRPGHGTVRKRKVSKTQNALLTMDGADERSAGSVDGLAPDFHEECSSLGVYTSIQSERTNIANYPFKPVNGVEMITIHKACSDCGKSLFTQNSQGGSYQGDVSSCTTREALKSMDLGDATNATVPSLDSHLKSVSLPSRRPQTSVDSEGIETPTRNFTTIPIPLRLHEVTPSPRQYYSSFETEDKWERQDAGPPIALMCVGSDLPSHATNDNVNESSMDLDDVHDKSNMEHPRPDFTSDTKPSKEVVRQEPYDGFPPELLGSINMSRRRAALSYASMTLPRMADFSTDADDTPLREPDFGDDRCSLPSQHPDGMRSSSFWV